MKFPKRLTRSWALALAGAMVVAALAYVALRSGPLAPVRVTVTQAAEGRLAPALFGIGTVEARRSYLIGPTAAGRVRRVFADVGETVRAGQLLAEMDPVDLDERMAALDAAFDRGGSALRSALAQRDDAWARLQLAQVNARRYQELGRQGFISAGALEARLQEHSSADAAHRAADANVSAARQELQRLAADKDGLRRQRENLRLLAPASGVVVSRDAEAGSTVVAGQPVLRLIEPSALWVKVRFDQGRSAGLTSGLTATVVLRSRPDAPLAGKVARVEWLSDSVTEERVAQISLDEWPPDVSVGELAEVTLQLDPAPAAILVPNAAIQRRAGQMGVWRLDGEGLRHVPVRVGAHSLDGQVQVLAGLSAGDRLVVYSERELDAGNRVKVVDALTGGRP